MNTGYKCAWTRSRLRGFALPDLVTIIAAILTLAALVVARAVTVSQKQKLERCVANLRQVNGSVLAFCEDNQQTLPAARDTAPANLWWFYKEEVKVYLGLEGPSSKNDLLFACPSDRGYSDPVPFHLDSRFDYGSYVFNGVTLPGMPNIAGLELSSLKQPKRTLLVMEWTAHAPLSWHNSRTGKENMPFYCDAQSVVGFVDGHVNFTKIYYDGYNAAYTRDPIPGYDYQFSGN